MAQTLCVCHPGETALAIQQGVRSSACAGSDVSGSLMPEAVQALVVYGPAFLAHQAVGHLPAPAVVVRLADLQDRPDIG